MGRQSPRGKILERGFLFAMRQALSTFGWATLSSVRCENKYVFYKKWSFYFYLILIFYVRSFQFSTKIIKTDSLSVRIQKIRSYVSYERMKKIQTSFWTNSTIVYIYRMHHTNVWNFGFLSVACITYWRNGNFWTKSKVRFSFVLSKWLFRKLLLWVDTIDINPMQIFRILSHLKSCHAFDLSV